ncbi:MAG: hypothetical protein ABEJ35_02865 [Halobacteriaceae archaeon]
MVTEAEVRLLCPACTKAWQERPRELPSHTEEFRCPDCDETRKTSEFARTETDLKTLKRLQS